MVLQHAANTPPGSDAGQLEQEVWGQPQLSQKHVVWCRGLVQSGKGEGMLSDLRVGSHTANTKLPKKQLLQLASSFCTETALEQS